MNPFNVLILILSCALVSAQTSQQIDIQRRNLVSDFVNEILKELKDSTECGSCEVMPLYAFNHFLIYINSYSTGRFGFAQASC
jgi:hypothetical protein